MQRGVGFWVMKGGAEEQQRAESVSEIEEAGAKVWGC